VTPRAHASLTSHRRTIATQQLKLTSTQPGLPKGRCQENRRVHRLGKHPVLKQVILHQQNILRALMLLTAVPRRKLFWSGYTFHVSCSLISCSADHVPSLFLPLPLRKAPTLLQPDCRINCKIRALVLQKLVGKCIHQETLRLC